jgi:hypothetical protein
MSMESRIAQRWAGTEKTSRLLKRHIKILEKYLDGMGLDGWEQIEYDHLPPRVKKDLDRVKAGESLWSDVNRFIDDYMNDKRYRRASEKTAATNSEGEGFPEPPWDVLKPLIASQRDQKGEKFLSQYGLQIDVRKSKGLLKIQRKLKEYQDKVGDWNDDEFFPEFGDFEEALGDMVDILLLSPSLDAEEWGELCEKAEEVHFEWKGIQR